MYCNLASLSVKVIQGNRSSALCSFTSGWITYRSFHPEGPSNWQERIRLV